MEECNQAAAVISTHDEPCEHSYPEHPDPQNCGEVFTKVQSDVPIPLRQNAIRLAHEAELPLSKTQTESASRAPCIICLREDSLTTERKSKWFTVPVRRKMEKAPPRSSCWRQLPEAGHPVGHFQRRQQLPSVGRLSGQIPVIKNDY